MLCVPSCGVLSLTRPEAAPGTGPCLYICIICIVGRSTIASFFSVGLIPPSCIHLSLCFGEAAFRVSSAFISHRPSFFRASTYSILGFHSPLFESRRVRVLRTGHEYPGLLSNRRTPCTIACSWGITIPCPPPLTHIFLNSKTFHIHTAISVFTRFTSFSLISTLV